MRYIVRPNGILTSPKALKEELERQSLFNYQAHKPRKMKTILERDSRKLNFDRDVFLTYPASLTQHISLENISRYKRLSKFAASTKADQRRYIHSQDLVTPESFIYSGLHAKDPNTGKFLYVRRPLRHSQGQGFEVTDNPLLKEGTYVSPLIKKDHEYRVIFVKGRYVLTLLKKKQEEGTLPNPCEPWNHANGYTFITVNNPENNRLRHSRVIQDLASLPITKDASIVAYDVLFAKLGSSVFCPVLEANFAPGLTIENNLQKVVKNVLL